MKTSRRGEGDDKDTTRFLGELLGFTSFFTVNHVPLCSSCSKQEDEKAWSAEWGGKILFSHGSEHSKGVCNPNSTFQLSTVEIDSYGRYIIAKLQIEETIFFLVNIYAPNDHREQEQFIRTF